MAPPRTQRRLAPSVASSRINSGNSLYRDTEWGPRQWSSDGAGSVYSFLRVESYDVQDYTTVKRRNNGIDRRMTPSSKAGSRLNTPASKGSSRKGSSGKAGTSTGSSRKPSSIQCHPPSPRPTLKESNAMETSAGTKKMSQKVPKQHKIRYPPNYPLSATASKTSKNSRRSGPPTYPKTPVSLASKRVVHKTLKPFPSTPSVKTHSSLGATHSLRTTRSAKTTTSMAPSTKTTRTSTSEPCSPRHVKWKLPTLNSFRSKDSADKDENLQPIPLTLLEKGKKKKNSRLSLRSWTNPRNTPPNHRPKPQLEVVTPAGPPVDVAQPEEEEEEVRVNADEDGDDDEGNDLDEETVEEQNSADSPGPPTHIAHRRIRKMSFTKRFLMRKAEENEANSQGSKKSKSSQKSKNSQKNKGSSDKNKTKHGTGSVKSKSSSKKSASSGKKTGGEKVEHDSENNNNNLVHRGVSSKTTALQKENHEVEELGLVQLPHPEEENAGKKQAPTPQLKQLTIEDARDLLGDKDSVKIFNPNPNANIVLGNVKKPKGFRWLWRERKPRQKLRKINKVQLQKWLEYAQGAIDEAYIEGVVEADSSLSSYYSMSDCSETGLSHILDDVGVEDVRQLFAEAQGHVTFADTTTLGTLATDDARSISSVEIMFNWLTCNNNDDEMQFVEVQESKDEPIASNLDERGYEGAIVFHKGSKSSAAVSTIVKCAPITHCM